MAWTEANHEVLVDRLVATDPVRRQVAQWLSGKGYAVEIPALEIAPTAAERMNFVDNGDLYVSMRVEVKKLSAKFTCAEDFPHRPFFMVCAKRSYDHAKPKPYAYILLNDSRTHAGFVMRSSSSFWYVDKRFDKREGIMQDFYFCPLEYVTFLKL